MVIKRKRGRAEFNARRDKPQDDLLTVCKKCVKGIFKGQERVWTKNGLIHKGCRTNEDVDAA